MARLHLSFSNIHRSVIRATEKLFEERPWTGTDEEKHVKFERWLRRAARAYGLDYVPALEVRYALQGSGLCGTTDGRTIVMRRYSVTTLFHEFRHVMQLNGMGPDPDQQPELAEADALKWSTSLFYRTNPRAFRKAVRKGTIVGVNPTDLLHPDAVVSMCRHCEENIWLTTEGEHEAWRHIESGNVGCELEVELGALDDELVASPLFIDGAVITNGTDDDEEVGEDG